jgi:hypothetical protein
MEDEEKYTVFRYIHLHPDNKPVSPVTFVVRFKFSRLSYKGNRIASLIPMLVITGYPGFLIKAYGVNFDNGYWQGMYQWASKQALDEYKCSFVYKMMNKRAVNDSLSSKEYPQIQLSDLLEAHKA